MYSLSARLIVLYYEKKNGRMKWIANRVHSTLASFIRTTDCSLFRHCICSCDDFASLFFRFCFCFHFSSFFSQLFLFLMSMSIHLYHVVVLFCLPFGKIGKRGKKMMMNITEQKKARIQQERIWRVKEKTCYDVLAPIELKQRIWISITL